METSQHLLELEMPVGYRFVPTDEELVKYYLANKVLYKPLPVKIIREIDAHDLYSKHPKCLVGNGTFNDNEREWLFFIYKDEYFLGKTRSTRMVGNGIGFWRFIGEEEPIHNSEGDIFAFKIYLTYFFSFLFNLCPTHFPADSKLGVFRLIHCHLTYILRMEFETLP
nr:NAC domain-containing protein 101-like [Coffea arabica]